MAKQPQRRTAPAAKKTSPAPARRQESKRDNVFSAGSREFIFNKNNFVIMGVGLLLIVLGLVTMSGGAMADPNEWKPEEIYSFRRITLSPIFMLAGFLVVIYGIFKKTNTSDLMEENETTA